MTFQRPNIVPSQSNSVDDGIVRDWRRTEDLQPLLDLMADYYWESDEHHRITEFLNAAGRRQSFFLGMPWWLLGGLPVFEGKSWDRLITIFAEKNLFVDFLIKQIVPDQGLKFLNVSGQPVYDDDTHFIGYRGIVRDITDNSLAQLLRINENKIQKQINSNGDLDITLNFATKLLCDSFLWSEGRYWRFDKNLKQLTQHAHYQRTQSGYTAVSGESIHLSDKAKVNKSLIQAISKASIQWQPDFDGIATHCQLQTDDKSYRTSVVVPVIGGEGVVGVFEIFSDFSIPKEPTIFIFLQRIAETFAQLIDRLNNSGASAGDQDREQYLISHTPSWYWEVDEDGCYTYFSGKAVELNPDLFNSFLGKRPWENDIEMEEKWDNLQSIFRTKASFENHIFRVRFKTGKELDLRFSGDPIFNPDGKFLGYRGIGQDITKRAEAEKTLEDTKTHLEVILNSTDAGLYRLKFVDGSEAIRIAAWDENFARLYGCPHPETATIEDIIRRVHPDDVSSAKERIWKSISEGSNEHQNEYRVLLDDGSNRWLFTSAKIHRDENGKPESITGVVIDVTDRKHIEDSLKEAQMQLRTALYSTNIGLFKFAYDSDIEESFDESNPLVWNFNMAPLYGYALDAKMDSRNFFNSVHPDDMEAAKRMVDEHVKNKTTDHQHEYRVIWPDGSVRWLYSRATLSYTTEGKLRDMIGIAVDITERKEAEEKIQYLATHDGLTGLPNRNVFNQLLEHEIHVARRGKDKFCIMFIDLDRFKMINDSLGHDAGDQLLQSMAQRLQSSIRDGDIVSRLGGDEFVILAREITSDHQAANLAQKILHKISEPIFLSNHEYRITGSIGIATYPVDGEDELTLMKNADVAMYLAKEEGKNNFQFYSSSIKTLSLEKLTLENDLRKALANNEFYLDYQAKVHMSDKSIAGVEALIRWKHPELGLVSPDQFIPLAEETGTIIPIGRWVLETACNQARLWLQQGLPPICISVNLSPRQFSDPHLLQDIAEVLEKTELQPNLLELEITESMVMNNADRAVMLLKSIKTLGVRLAIDDFGTGYSSLGQLKQFPIDTLKVDKSFIQHIPVDAEDKAITEAIIAMGKSLSLTVIAEGVENSDQQSFLQAHACDQMQGFYFSRPVSADDFAEFVRSKLPV